ncbi:DUF3795 domain-containing protein [Acutalibacter sp. 1XD8-33]|uniref:DUF3795 domain-containing protein n=1 Tax=Acutalibacter sp. 1XD8-33 TaxID=2320081 RepID=UPI001FA9848A|nr:DUF3795 domain-containing protein [Acutalibacter sp. 1XD8-33]
MHSYCGIDCGQCWRADQCAGCLATEGKPFADAGVCPLAACCREKGQERCGQCDACQLKDRLIREFNDLGIQDMEVITGLNTLPGSYINLEYTLPGGQKVKLLDDSKVYMGNQVCKAGSKRCYGLAADEDHLLVCEYGENGSDPEIIIYKKRSVVGWR